MNPLIKQAREQARAKNRLLHRGRASGKIKAQRRKFMQEAKAKAKSASQRVASTAKNAAQTHGIPAMPKTNMIPV